MVCHSTESEVCGKGDGHHLGILDQPKKLLFRALDQARRLLARSENSAIPARRSTVRRPLGTRGCKAPGRRRPPAWCADPPLLPHPLRLHRSYEPLFVSRSRDGGRQGPARIQCGQHRPAAASHIHLQLLFPPRIPRWPGRLAAAPVPCRVRFVEVCKGVGTIEKALNRVARTLLSALFISPNDEARTTPMPYPLGNDKRGFLRASVSPW